jgi:hypothetical protein
VIRRANDETADETAAIGPENPVSAADNSCR